MKRKPNRKKPTRFDMSRLWQHYGEKKPRTRRKEDAR